MGLIDRYTILKWKESLSILKDGFTGRVLRLYSLCNESNTTRAISLAVVFVLILLTAGITALLRPEKPVSAAHKIVLSATDPKGDTWKMEYLKNQNLGTLLNGPVKPGQPLKLTFKFLRKGTNLLIKPEIAGAAGEQYFPGILKNSQWQPAPKFTITDQNGKLLHRGQFEYG